MYRRSKAITATQRGAVLPLGAISLVVLLGMAGLALDFSNTLVPFTPGAVNANANLIRIRVNDLSFNTWLVRVLGFQNRIIGASAVAGPTQAAPAAVHYTYL